MPSVPSLLVAEDHDRIAALTWYARGVVEGLHAGMHRSPYIGVSVEFKEHRPYVRGDEVRSIDWKLYGKTDRLFIRQYEHESNLTATLLVDQSGSMGYQGTWGNGISKHVLPLGSQPVCRICLCRSTMRWGSRCLTRRSARCCRHETGCHSWSI